LIQPFASAAAEENIKAVTAVQSNNLFMIISCGIADISRSIRLWFHLRRQPGA
jgi:hypothetical protein